MGYVTNDMIMLVIVIGFSYLLYRKDRLLGNIGFLAISIASLVITDIDRAFIFLIFGISIVNLSWDIFQTTIKHRYNPI